MMVNTTATTAYQAIRVQFDAPVPTARFTYVMLVTLMFVTCPTFTMAEVIEGHIREHAVRGARAKSEEGKAAQDLVDIIRSYLK